MTKACVSSGTGSSGAVFVLGASRGIGLATASQLAQGGTPVIFGCRNPATVVGHVEQLVGTGAKALAVAVDAQSASSIDKAYEQTRALAGGISALIYNAGCIDPIGSFSEIVEADWESVVSTNLLGAARAVRQALPFFTSAPRIIFLSSGAARQAVDGWSAYCVSKAGLSMLTKALALELGQDAFVCGLSPGMADTDMQASVRASERGPISKVPRSELTSADAVGEALAALAVHAPRALHGRDVTLHEARSAVRTAKN